MELSASMGINETLNGITAAYARVDAISSQATGQATSFASVLSDAQAAVDGDAARTGPGATPVAQERRANLAALMALRSSRSATLGQALSLWGAAASGGGGAGVESEALSSVASSVGKSSEGPVPLVPGDASWAEGLPPAGQKIAGAVDAAARAEGVDPRLLASLVWAESAFHQGSVSHVGAAGLTQLMPATAAGLGVDASDPAQNLRGGARYLKIQLDRFGSPDLALAAYNAGPGRVRQAGGIPDIPETRGYVRTVMGHYRDLGGLA